MPGSHEFIQQGHRVEQGVLWERVVPAINDELDRVETNVISQRQGPHGVTGTKAHGLINGLLGGIAPLQHSDGLAQKRNQQPVDDETGGVAATDGSLSKGLCKCYQGLKKINKFG